jgi:hypothetical protein
VQLIRVDRERTNHIQLIEPVSPDDPDQGRQVNSDPRFVTRERFSVREPAEDGSIRLEQEIVDAGLFERDEAGQWRPAAAGSLVAPLKEKKFGLKRTPAGAMLERAPADYYDQFYAGSIWESWAEAHEVVFPAGEIGPGASWTVERAIPLGDAFIKARTRFHLEKIDKGVLFLRTEIDGELPPGKVRMKTPQGGGEADFQSYKLTGSGTIEVDPRLPMPRADLLELRNEARFVYVEGDFRAEVIHDGRMRREAREATPTGDEF